MVPGRGQPDVFRSEVCMKTMFGLATLLLLLVCVGCEEPGVYGGGYGAYGEYPYTYGGTYAYPAYPNTYSYPYYGPYDRDHFYDRDRHWERHRWHGDYGWGHGHDRDDWD